MIYRPGPQQLCGQTAQRRSNSPRAKVSAGITAPRKVLNRRRVSFRHTFRLIDFSQYLAGSQGASAAYFHSCIGSSPEELHQGADRVNCQALAQPVGESSSRLNASAIRSMSSSVAASGIIPKSPSTRPARYRTSSRRAERRNAFRRLGGCASNHAWTQNPNANCTCRNTQNPVDRGHVADSSLNTACQVARHFALGVGAAA